MSQSNERPKRSLESHMVVGTALGMLLRWGDRVTGFICTIILVRYLSPEDYGILAIASVIIAAAATISAAGRYAVLIRHANPTREHYDTAWTVGLILDLVTAAVIFAASPLTTIYFNEPRAQLVVQILAIPIILDGLQNIGIADFRRSLNFMKQFWYQLLPTVFAFVIQITAGIILRTYWALVIGSLSRGLSMLLLSYVMSPYRPWFSLAKFKDIWSYSFWVVVKSMGNMAAQQVDKIAVGGFAGTAVLGRYNVAREIATIPGQELLEPMAQALLPVMASSRGNRKQQQELYLTVLYWSGVVFSVTGIGIALVADDMTDLLLGPQWADVKPFMPWFALAFGVVALTSSVYTAFDTLGRPDIASKLQWVRVLCYVVAVSVTAYMYHDVVAVIISRLVVAVLLTPPLFYSLGRAMDMAPRQFLAALWRPITAGLIMAGADLELNSVLWFTGPLRLLLDIAAGGFVFGASLLLLWLIAGCPAGPEHAVWSTARRYLDPYLSR